uniref:X-box-binding protein 1 n=1 Tax=Romanomermis culicivorax TaxID=13658 RepID=A0A915J5V4_ROMCU
MQNPPKTIIITAFNGQKLAQLKPKNVLLSCRPSSTAQQNLVRNIQHHYRPASTCSTISSTTLKRPLLQPSRVAILPSPSPCPSSMRSYDDDDDDYGSDVEFDMLQPPRKRERLNHLTPEEKMYRRKMKNRIAAQSARDRKKMQMMDLEERIKRLEAENEALRHQNSKLSSVSSNLNDENSRLKCQLSEKVEIPQKIDNDEVVICTSSQPISDTSIDSTTTNSNSSPDCCTETVALESAAFINGLQQQGQATEGVHQSSAMEASSFNKNHSLILFLAVIAAMNNYSIGCETFSSKNFKAIYVQQRHLYEKMNEQQLEFDHQRQWQRAFDEEIGGIVEMPENFQAERCLESTSFISSNVPPLISDHLYSTHNYPSQCYSTPAFDSNIHFPMLSGDNSSPLNTNQQQNSSLPSFNYNDFSFIDDAFISQTLENLPPLFENSNILETTKREKSDELSIFDSLVDFCTNNQLSEDADFKDDEKALLDIFNELLEC